MQTIKVQREQAINLQQSKRVKMLITNQQIALFNKMNRFIFQVKNEKNSILEAQHFQLIWKAKELTNELLFYSCFSFKKLKPLFLLLFY